MIVLKTFVPTFCLLRQVKNVKLQYIILRSLENKGKYLKQVVSIIKELLEFQTEIKNNCSIVPNQVNS